MRVLIVLLGCVAAALAHGTATTAPTTPAPVARGGTGSGAEALARGHGGGIGVGVHVGGGRGGRFGGGRFGRGFGYGGLGGGWIYPGVADQVVVDPTAAYGYGLGGYGLGGYYGGGYVQQPPVVVAQQPPQVVVAQQPAQVVYTQAAPPETAMVPGGSFVAASAPAAPAGGFVATAAAPASTTYTQTTTATDPGAAGFIATAAPATGPTVVATQAPTVIASAPSASYVTADSMVPGLTYASPYFFGAGSPVVYSGYLGGPTGWYASRGRRFGRRFGSGVFGVTPFGYGAGGMMYGGTSILGNILGGVTGTVLPPVYVGGGIGIGGGRFGGGRFGGGRFGGGRGGGHGGGRRHLEQDPGQVGNNQALHQVGDVESLPTTTIPSTNPSADIMQLGGGAKGNVPAQTEPQKPQAIIPTAQKFS